MIHNLTHAHYDIHAPDTAPVQGYIAICCRKWNGRVKSAAWMPEGFRWGYVIPDEMGIREVLDMLSDADVYKSWVSTARRTNE